MRYVTAVLGLLLFTGTMAFAQRSQPSAMADPSPTTGNTGVASETLNASAQLKQMEDDWVKATVQKNKVEIARIEALDYQSITADGKVHGQQEDIAALANANYTDISNSDLEIRMYGDTGIVTGIAHVKGQENGEDITGDYRFTDVFVKRDGKWQAVNTATTRLMP